jgi:[ribosomal protein S5]-alanine N-acetyltransferase
MNFELRSWQMSDLPSLVEHANNFNIAKNLTDGFPHPYSEESGRFFITEIAAKNPEFILAIVIEGKAVGAIGIHPQTDIMRKNAELGYWLSEKYWGKGIVTQAIKLIVEKAFKQLDIVRIYARPFGFNLPSQRVLEKAGFILEARISQNIFKNGAFEDELIYAKRR